MSFKVNKGSAHLSIHDGDRLMNVDEITFVDLRYTQAHLACPVGVRRPAQEVRRGGEVSDSASKVKGENP